MIPFNVPPQTGSEANFVLDAVSSGKFSGGGPYTQQCESWFEESTGSPKALLTPSCTHALEMAAMLIDIQPGDEVIMPSYTFVSTANAFVLRGAQIVFVDVRPDTMNIDEKLIEAAVTSRTKAVVPVHYAGVSCEMDAINEIAERHNLFVVEDAAQGMMARYKGQALGTLGDFGAYSFHETKNYTAGGEGGLLLVKGRDSVSRAEVIREKGTNRSQFFRGMVDKYQWVDVGSSYLASELQAAYLWGQINAADAINAARLECWKYYYEAFLGLAQSGAIELPYVPEDCDHNAHMFYIKCKNLEERSALVLHLKARGVLATFHYVPLHSSKAGQKFSRFHGEDVHTTAESERLLRLPMYFGLDRETQQVVIDAVAAFYR